MENTKTGIFIIMWVNNVSLLHTIHMYIIFKVSQINIYCPQCEQNKILILHIKTVFHIHLMKVNAVNKLSKAI